MTGARIKLLLAIICLPLFACLVNAQSLLEIEPSQISITANTSQQIIQKINLTNNHEFTIYEITFEDQPEITFPTIDNLGPGETAVIEIFIESDEAVTKTINSIVSYSYFIDVSNNPQTKEVNISANSFNPVTIKINALDSILFRNIDTNAHNIKNNELGIDKIISAGTTYSKQFTLLGNFTIIDIFGFGMALEVNQNAGQELTHNPNFDQAFNINLNTLYSQTGINMELIGANAYTLNNGQETDGLLKVINTGNEIAKNVQLSSNKWVTFNQNNLDIASGSNKIISYTIKPEATVKNQTNLNHQIVLTATGLNTNQASQNINVFVNLDQSLPDQDYSALDFDSLYNQFLQLLDRIRLLNQTQTNQSGNLTVELNRDSVLEALKGIIDIKGDTESRNLKQDNYYTLQDQNNEKLEALDNRFNNYTNYTNSKLTSEEEQNKQMILGIGAIISLFTITIIGYSIKEHRDKSITSSNEIGLKRKRAWD